MRIYELGGVDNSGKTTQIGLLEKKLCTPELFIPPSLVSYTSRLPQIFEERVQWYQQAPVEEKVKAFFTGAKNRNDDILAKKPDLVILDRGFITLRAANAARVMKEKKVSSQDAYSLVDKIIYDCGYGRIEDKSAILFFDSDPIEIIEKRENKPFDEDFQTYLRHFNSLLKHTDYEHAVKIDASQSLEEVHNQILQHLFR